MPTLKEVSKGLRKALNSKELTALRNRVLDQGREAGVNAACKLGQSKLGLPESICHKVANRVITDLTKEIRSKISKKS